MHHEDKIDVAYAGGIGGLVILIILILLAALTIRSCAPKPAEAAETVSTWQGIVIHHSGTNPTHTPNSITRYHTKTKGWEYCGYHYIIDQNGIVYGQGYREFDGMRPISKAGAHARTGKPHSRNRTHIGICLIGNKTFSDIQISVMKTLCMELAAEYPIKTIERHHEECPGPGINVEALNQRLMGRL